MWQKIKNRFNKNKKPRWVRIFHIGVVILVLSGFGIIYIWELAGWIGIIIGSITLTFSGLVLSNIKWGQK